MGYYLDRNFIRVNRNGQFAGRIPKHRFAWMTALHGWYRGVAIPFAKRVLRWTLVLSTAAGISYAYAMTNLKPETVIEYVRENCERGISGECVPPVLVKIATAESHNKHFNDKGKVLQGKKDPMDIGRYQINLKYWFIACNEQGYNIYEEIDNEKCALWIFKNYGTEPWKNSKGTWVK